MASPTSPSGADVPPVLPSIPLAPETAPPADGKSIGALVTDVTTQLSNLVRAEVELAKAEVTAEVRKGVTGSVFFAVAGAIGLFSLFYFFFALAELLSLWFLRWVAFAIANRESADMLQHLGRSDGPPELDAPSSASAR